MLTMGSLCSGACDGLSLGMEWAGLGPVLWQVELDESRRQNLARHWPNADRSVSDVTAAGARNLRRVDLIVASSPCQDISSAGARAGITGPKSSLWFECQRVIGELRPRFVVVENVASGARNWVPFVRGGLAGLGYSSLPVPVAASDCGAPHIRRRVLVLAYLDGDREPAGSVDAKVASASHVGHVGCEPLRRQPADAEQEGAEAGVADQGRTHEGWPTELEVCAPPDGVSRRVVSALGDSVVPQCSEVVGWIIRELMAAERDC